LDEIELLLQRVDDWALEAVEEGDQHQLLEKSFKFKGFMPGVSLVNQIALLAETEGHHPDLVLRYGSLMVQLWTHAAGGLTENDFILAAKIDQVANQG
jgi:4a-hydroxytetrahydrobiopterin dehydratase